MGRSDHWLNELWPNRQILSDFHRLFLINWGVGSCWLIVNKTSLLFSSVCAWLLTRAVDLFAIYNCGSFEVLLLGVKVSYWEKSISCICLRWGALLIFLCFHCPLLILVTPPSSDPSLLSRLHHVYPLTASLLTSSFTLPLTQSLGPKHITWKQKCALQPAAARQQQCLSASLAVLGEWVNRCLCFAREFFLSLSLSLSNMESNGGQDCPR